jgi:hypothetical protein
MFSSSQKYPKTILNTYFYFKLSQLFHFLTKYVVVLNSCTIENRATTMIDYPNDNISLKIREMMKIICF